MCNFSEEQKQEQLSELTLVVVQIPAVVQQFSLSTHSNGNIKYNGNVGADLFISMLGLESDYTMGLKAHLVQLRNISI